MVHIRKIVTTRGISSRRSSTDRPAQGLMITAMATARTIRLAFEAGAMLGERLMPEFVKLLGGPAVSYGKGALVGKAVISSNVKVAAAGASLDVPLGHKDDSWSFPHFDTITASVADAPRTNAILVVMAIADGGRLQNRCGTEPIR